MKSIILVTVWLAFFATGCSSAPTVEITEQPEVEKEVITETEQEQLTGNYHYDTDWETIKESIFNNDLVALQAYVNEANVDPLDLLTACKEDYIIEKLQTIAYADLEVDFIEDEVFLVFFASGGGTFTMYLFQGEKNLYVDYFIVGG
jgi:hypothetical protein